jgi:hypothetical protein
MRRKRISLQLNEEIVKLIHLERLLHQINLLSKIMYKIK